MHKFWSGLFLVVLLSLVLVPSALAVDRQAGGRLVIEQNQTIDDDLLYTGTSLVIDGTVHGDVFAFGDSVTVNGTIDGNLVAFGSRVEVRGTVKGSVFGAANDVSASGRIDGSILAGGNTVTVDRTASVGHSVIMAGSQLRSDGNIGRGMLVAGGSLDIGGQVGRQLEVYAGDLTVHSGAVVSGPVTYHGNKPAIVDPGAHTGKLTYFQTKNRMNFGVQSTPKVKSVWWTALKFAGFILAGLVLLSLFPGLRRSFPQALESKPWQAPVAGFLALVGIPVAVILLLVTVVGIPLALVSLLLMPIALYVGQVLFSWTVARLVADRVESLQSLNWAVLFLLGALTTTILVQLPVVGGFIGFLAVVYGLGGLYFTVLQQREPA